MKTLRVGFISAALLCLTGASVFAQDSTFQMVSMWHGIPEATVSAVGLASGASGLDEVPGSLHLITTKELKRFSYTDPLRTLRTVAGVNITEEDGFGLRPNIGLRGSGTERSSRITIMEDGVLIAPAPYTASSAYYFPSIARMSSVEILKGSSQIAFGPQTASGAINLISTQIPDVETASFSMSHGSFKNRYVHMYVGNSVTSGKGTFGYLIEFLEIGSDGFKTLDNEDPTGFIKSDRLAKLKWSSPVSASVQQSLQLKLADVTETSHETYLGLSEVDFAISPNRRYAASAQDVMNTEQTQTVLTHTVAPSKRLEIKTDIYRTTFHRNWYKLDRAVDSTGTTMDLGEILNSPDDFSEGYSYLTGSSTIGLAGLDVQANNRNYFAQGIQSRLIYTFGKAEVKNRIIFGSRFHRDLVDRFQWRDRYSMDNGTMELVTPGIHGTAGNRVESASALANYLRATLHFGDFTLTPGLRHENISFERYDYGSSDLERLGNGDYRVNNVSVLLPGVGLNYQISSALDLFTGVHRGFIPPGSKPQTEPELSINSELGVRFSHRYVSAQMVIFSNNYSNLLGADLNASDGTGSGDLFNGGSAMANGLEFELAVDPFTDGPCDHISMPVRIAYTYTDATFTNAFDSDFGAWGDVEVGDALPYLAPHQLSLVTSFEHEKIAIDISGRFTSAMRTVAGQGEILLAESTDESLIFDSGIRYEVSNHLNVTLGVTNLLDRAYAVSRRPYGLRPNMPRALRIGVSVNI
ncbi:MAG: TonB-dependent receptor [Bacteroidetes bacterium]|nr:TonB-dependent receptor [Bacteroidota bacterium]MDA0980767.1 TonB-dependent receptor [Bacteroidota bacterium]